MNLNNSEWAVMEVLWQEQPRTLMQLVKELESRLRWSKSTTNTMLRRMHEKGYIRYEEGQKARKYFACMKRENVVLDETQNFLERAYEGKLGLLLSTFVDHHKFTDLEIKELKEILHKADKQS